MEQYRTSRKAIVVLYALLKRSCLLNVRGRRLMVINVEYAKSGSRTTKEELHVLRRKFLHGNLIIVDGAVDHVRLLLL